MIRLPGTWQEVTIGALTLIVCVLLAYTFASAAGERDRQERQFCEAIPNAAAAGATAASQALIDVIVVQRIRDGAGTAEIDRARVFGGALVKRAAAQARTNAARYLPDCSTKETP